MKNKLKFPIIKKNKSSWPDKALCPICKKNKVFEPHSMAILSAGALLMDRKNKFGSMSNDMDGFLDIIWHGAHDNGLGTDREIGCVVQIMRNVYGGQGELYFCSTSCLRFFLNSCVDELEKKIKSELK